MLERCGVRDEARGGCALAVMLPVIELKATLKDVAFRAGVGLATVSRVINGNYPVSAETREKVLSAVEALDYRPNSVARSLRAHKTWVVGAVVANISNAFYMQLIKGVENVIYERGYSIIIASTDEEPAKERKIIDLMIDRQVDGLLVATCQTDGGYFNGLKQGVPIAMADRAIKGVNYDAVVEDNETASCEITKHLIDMGHRKICVLNGNNAISTSVARYNGFLLAHKETGVPLMKNHALDGSFGRAYGNLNRLFAETPAELLPTAIFATNNTRAETVLRVLLERGISVPDDISLVSYGDITNPFIYPIRLTHVRQDVLNLGKKAGELLLELISGEAHTYVRQYVISDAIQYGGSVKRLREF